MLCTRILAVLLSFGFAISSWATVKIENINMRDKRACQIRTVVQNPPANVPVKSDLIFLIGFADRADNHEPLFSALADQGVRVISFDYPMHGETQCGSLNERGFGFLAKMALSVEEQTRDDANRPLFISGWSTGGLLALRMAQLWPFQRKIQGMVLITPGIAVRANVGENGKVTENSLTSNPNPPHKGPIKPASPMEQKLFAADLALNSLAVRDQGIIRGLPTLIIFAGDEEDLYVKNSRMKDWLSAQRSLSKKKFEVIQFFNRKHELDNEEEHIAQAVRHVFADFLRDAEGFAAGPSPYYDVL